MPLTKTTYSMINGAVLNVLDFGAVGDGVADDTAAIQAAIAAGTASSLTPRAIYFPTGLYKVTSPLTCGAYGNFIGETRRSIIYFDHNGTGLELTGGIGRIEKMHFNRRGSFLNNGINLYFNAAAEWVLEAVRSSVSEVGIQSKNSTLLSFKDCVLDSNITGYLDEGRCPAQTWVNGQFYRNTYGCDLKSEHTFVGGAIELSLYNDAQLSTTADFNGNYNGVAQFFGVHFEARDGLTASTDPNLLVGPNSAGTNSIRLTVNGCLFTGNSSARPAISMRRLQTANIMSVGISGYNMPVAGIISTSATSRLVTGSLFNTVATPFSISTATRWTDFDGDDVLTNTVTIRDPYTSVPSASSGRATMFVDPSDGDLKIIFSDGTVKTIVTDT